MAGIISLLTCGKSSKTLESETEQQEPQARWELLQLRQWEQQIRESCTPSCIQSTGTQSKRSHCIQSQDTPCHSSCIQSHTPPVTCARIQCYVPLCTQSAPTGEDKEQSQLRLAQLPEAAATVCSGISRRKSKNCLGRVWQNQEAKRSSLPQEQHQNNALLSPNPPKTDVRIVPKHNANKHETTASNNHALNWDAKTWRQNLFNAYADQCNRVQAEENFANTNFSRVGNSTLDEQENFDLSDVTRNGCTMDNARRNKKVVSEQRYLEALRHWAYSIEQAERSRRAQVQNLGEEHTRNNYQPLETKARRDHGKNEATSLGRRNSQIIIPSLDCEQILKIGPPHEGCAIMKPKRGCGEEQKIGAPKMKRGSDKGRGPGITADLKRSERKPSAQQPEEGQCNRSVAPMKIVLKGRGRVIQDGNNIILQGFENPKRLEGVIKPIEGAGRPKNVPFNELGRSERIQRTAAQNGCVLSRVLSTISESEESEGFELDAKGSNCSKKCREINGRPRKESNRRSKGGEKADGEEFQETQDPKGYKGSIGRKGGKDLPEVESGVPQKLGKRRQQWGQVDWSACGNNKGLIGAAHGMQSNKNCARAAAAIEERKLSCLQPRSCLLPRYRTLYRLKDTYCEELRDDLCGATTHFSGEIRNR